MECTILQSRSGPYFTKKNTFRPVPPVDINQPTCSKKLDTLNYDTSNKGVVDKKGLAKTLLRHALCTWVWAVSTVRTRTAYTPLSKPLISSQTPTQLFHPIFPAKEDSTLSVLMCHVKSCDMPPQNNKHNAHLLTASAMQHESKGRGEKQHKSGSESIPCPSMKEEGYVGPRHLCAQVYHTRHTIKAKANQNHAPMALETLQVCISSPQYLLLKRTHSSSSLSVSCPAIVVELFPLLTLSLVNKLSKR
eukprot:1145510-Pelagomonas_calceolata.AAC.7